MITNRSTVQVPVLHRGVVWTADMLMPGIATFINDDDLTALTIGKMDPGAAPNDPDSIAARTKFLSGIGAMEGRSDAGVAQRVTPLTLLVENFASAIDVGDGTTTIATLAKGEGQEVTATQFNITMATVTPMKKSR